MTFATSASNNLRYLLYDFLPHVTYGVYHPCGYLRDLDVIGLMNAVICCAQKDAQIHAKIIILQRKLIDFPNLYLPLSW